ncbi:MAG: phosphoadenylyl-sulfate reductase [Proteobacteria bacterium]|nr:phosphoadenylyl-sulfate reductase [Pseudomonadota bacterium]
MNAAEQAAFLAESHAGLDGVALLRPLVTEVFAGRVALVSSFGTEAAVLLSLVAEVDPATPVVFLDTLKHFDATEAYRDTLAERLGLIDLRIVRPDPATLAQTDPDGTMWREAPDACCHIRKVLPLRAALRGFDAWITGRKRYQGVLRANLPAIEAEEGRIKINPLANWSPERIEEEFVARALPRHPLEAKGYYSIGCLPCTAQADPVEGPRSGRWADQDKTECGIHLPYRPATGSRAAKPREDRLLGRDVGKWPERTGAGC